MHRILLSFFKFIKVIEFIKSKYNDVHTLEYSCGNLRCTLEKLPDQYPRGYAKEQDELLMRTALCEGARSVTQDLEVLYLKEAFRPLQILLVFDIVM